MWMVGLVLGCVEQRLAMDVPVVAGGAGDIAWTTPDGGTVLVDAASITFSDLRLEQPANAIAAMLRTLSPVQSAYAHPGHDAPGDVAGELLGTYTVDLLGPDVELGRARCYEGAYGTARVTVKGTTAEVAGTYTNATDEVWNFRFEVAAEQDIVGIPFETTMWLDAPPAEVDLRFEVSAALAFVDWASPDSDGDGTLTVADGTYDNTVSFGVVATPTWTLESVRP